MKILTYLTAALFALSGLSVAAEVKTPEVIKPVPGESIVLIKMSNNGKWAVSPYGTATDSKKRPIVSYIYDLETLTQTPVTLSSGVGSINDITDDGNIAVGECNGVPGYWNRETDSWTKFKTPMGTNIGAFNAVTPDGRYAAGYFASTANEFLARIIAKTKRAAN